LCEGRRKKFYFGSILAFLLGLLAKVTVLTLPVVLILIDLYQGRKLSKQMVMEKIPYFGLTILFAIIAFFGKTDVLGASTLIEKILISAKGIVFYLEKLIVPLNLSVLYPLNGEVTFTNLSLLIPLLLVAALVVLALVALRKSRTLFFALAFFIVTLSPSLLNFVKGDVLYFASDRYTYISSISILFLLVIVIDRVRVCSVLGKYISGAIVSMILISFTVLAFLQSQTWRNSETLFSNVLDHYPQSYIALNNITNYISQIELKNKRPDLAIASYEEALALHEKFSRHPEGISARRSRSRILANFASAKRSLNDLSGAMQLYKQAIELNPENAIAHMGLGIVYGKQQRYNESEASYKRAIELAPHLATPFVNLGALYVGLGQIEEGIAQYDLAIERNPLYPQAHYNRGVALRKLQRNREAREEYEEAIRLAPDFLAARLNLSILYIERQWIDKAIEQLENVLRINPGNEHALGLLKQIESSL